MSKILQLNSTTFQVDNLGDVKPKVAIGGTSIDKFVPNINHAFYQGTDTEKEFLNFNAVGDIVFEESVELISDKAVQIIGDKKHEYYVDEEGKLKWDILFSKCPKDMVIRFNVTKSPGVRFEYQDALSEKEISESAYQPDWVAGSYAVYRNKAHDYCRLVNPRADTIDVQLAVTFPEKYFIDDKGRLLEYTERNRTGKLMHIPRPFVVDALGNREWADMKYTEISETSGVLDVFLPELFMTNADYKIGDVRLDPAFGYTTAGATQVYIYNTDKPVGSTYGAYAATAGQVITGFSFYGSGNGGATTARAAAYTVSSGNLASRLGSASAISVTADTQWHSASGLNIEMAAATYGFGLGCYGETRGIIMYQDTTYEDYYRKRHNTAEALPPTWTNDSSVNRLLSMYITWEEAGGTSYTRSISESIGISDAMVRIAGHARAALESIGISDSRSIIASFFRSRADSTGISDTNSRAGSFFRTAANTVGISDAMSAMKAFFITISDSIGVTDALSRAASFVRSRAENIGVADAMSRAVSYIRQAAEAISIAESMAAQILGNLITRTISEAVGIADNISRLVQYHRSVVESLSVSDAASRAVQFFRGIVDSLGIADFVSRIFSGDNYSEVILGRVVFSEEIILAPVTFQSEVVLDQVEFKTEIILEDV